MKKKKSIWDGFWKGSFLTLLVVIILCIIGFLILENTSFYQEVLLPSYYSVAGVCFPNGEQYIGNKGWQLGGYFNGSDNSITILIPEYNETISKHELCHFKQNEEGRIYYCNRILFMYLNEIECSLAERN
jgi:hypothetical protein